MHIFLQKKAIQKKSPETVVEISNPIAGGEEGELDLGYGGLQAVERKKSKQPLDLTRVTSIL